MVGVPTPPKMANTFSRSIKFSIAGTALAAS